VTAINRFRGDTIPDVFFVKNATGQTVDISGYSFKLSLNPSKAPADASAQIYQLTGVIADGPAGKVTFAPTLLQSGQLPGKYYYDVQMTDGGGLVTTIALDSYTYHQDITKN
jgi:hypothetical protein